MRGRSRCARGLTDGDAVLLRLLLARDTGHVSLGALGDSFYEYLLKAWLVSDAKDTDARSMYDAAMDAVVAKLVYRKSNPTESTFLHEWRSGHLDAKMDELVRRSPDRAPRRWRVPLTLGAPWHGRWQGVLCRCHVCAWRTRAHVPAAPRHWCRAHGDVPYGLRHAAYVAGRRCGATVGVRGVPTAARRAAATKIAPEAFRFVNGRLAPNASPPQSRYYILRPEMAESYFVLWRLTHEQKYRDWGWEMVQALDRHCRSPDGYSGLRDVTQMPPQNDDVQQSFFLAETLKYLYLLFSPDELISLDDYVFNTEAHPLPIRSKRQSLLPLADQFRTGRRYRAAA